MSAGEVVLVPCARCDELVDREVAHSVHEFECLLWPVSDDWACDCDAFAHLWCCEFCASPEIVRLLVRP